MIPGRADVSIVFHDGMRGPCWCRMRGTGKGRRRGRGFRVLAKLRAGKAGKEGYAKLLEGILLINPEDKRTWNRLGAWYLARRRLADAARCFRQAVSVDGEYVPAPTENSVRLVTLALTFVV